ncbi:MAG: hypothetical protein V1800_14100 [Candidatus Latescibacterota bacterium]
MSSIIGKIAKIVDETTFLLNKGAQDGVRNGMRFVVFDEGDEVSDPESGESLGVWEIVKGTLIVVNTQERLSMAQTPEKTKAAQSQTLSALMVEASRSGSGDQQREPLSINRSEMSGRPVVQAVSVGDPVRSVEEG